MPTQIAVNDYNKLGGVIEGLAWIAELICCNAILEDLYLRQTSEAAEELQRAIITLYTAVLIYLIKAKQYLEQSSTSKYI